MDFFALEPQLIARLQAQVLVDGKPIDVYSVDEVKIDANDEPQPLRVPCLLVSYDGYRTRESDQAKARVEQPWSVIVVVANVRGGGRAEARAESQALVDQTLKAVIGWTPAAVDGRAFKPLMLTDPSFPVGYGTRNSYFPFSFTTERVIRARS